MLNSVSTKGLLGDWSNRLMFLRSAAGSNGVGVLAVARGPGFVVAVDWAALGLLRRRNNRVHGAVVLTINVGDCVAKAAPLVVVCGLDSWGHVGVLVLLAFRTTGHAADCLIIGVEFGVECWYGGLGTDGADAHESRLTGLEHC